MSKLIVAYGPTGSGKSTAAHEWRGDDFENKRIYDDAGFNPASFAPIQADLDAGRDVWMNIILNPKARLLEIGVDGHEVELRRFSYDYELAQ